MNKHKNASLAKVISLFLTTEIEILFSIALILCFIFSSTIEYKIGFSITILSAFVFQNIIIELICFLFGKYGKHTIKISQNVIETEHWKIFADEARLFYSRISLRNIIDYCPGELTAIINGNEIKLGWYTRREIKEISKYIKNITII